MDHRWVSMGKSIWAGRIHSISKNEKDSFIGKAAQMAIAKSELPEMSENSKQEG